MESLGLLKELPLDKSFTFKGGEICYRVLSKKNKEINYRRIPRHYKNEKKVFEILDKRYKDYPENPFMKVYTSIGNIEVFEFLPF